MNSVGAITAAVGSAALSILLKIALPALPFMDRVGVVFLACIALAVIASIATRKSYVAGGPSVVSLDKVNFDTKGSFNILGIGILIILAALYATWW